MIGKNRATVPSERYSNRKWRTVELRQRCCPRPLRAHLKRFDDERRKEKEQVAGFLGLLCAVQRHLDSFQPVADSATASQGEWAVSISDEERKAARPFREGPLRPAPGSKRPDRMRALAKVGTGNLSSCVAKSVFVPVSPWQQISYHRPDRGDMAFCAGFGPRPDPINIDIPALARVTRL